VRARRRDMGDSLTGEDTRHIVLAVPTVIR
jgi:hypothetical protein